MRPAERPSWILLTSVTLLWAIWGPLTPLANPSQGQGELDELKVTAQRADERRARHGEHHELVELVEEGGLSVRRVGGMGSPAVISARGGGAHQLAVSLEGVPLQGSLSQGFDLSLFPSFTLGGLSIQEGVTSGESGAQTAALNLRLPSFTPGVQGRVQLATSSERGSELGLWTSYAGAQGGLGLWLSGGGGTGAYPYQDRYGTLKRREGASYQRGSVGVRGDVHFEGLTLRGFTALSGLQRGEPAPEGQGGLGGESEQESAVVSIGLEPQVGHAPRATQLIPQTQLYLHERAYLYTEASALWQGAKELRYQTDTRDIGLKLSWDLGGQAERQATPSRGWGWGVATQAHARQEVAELSAGAAGRAQYERARLSARPALRLTGPLPALGSFLFESALRLDVSTERREVWVPSVSLIARLTSSLSCTLRVSEAFRDPSFDERYLRGPGIIPNPSLRPEEGWWTDVGCGVGWRRAGLRGRLSAQAFYQDYERLILFIPLDPYRVQASDEQGALVRGATAKGRASLVLRAPWPVIKLEGRVTLQEHELTTPPYTPLPLRPLYHGWGRVGLYLRPSELWVKLIQRGPLYADRYGLRRLPQAQRVSLGVSRTWRLSPLGRIRADASLRNALDQVIRDAVLRPLPGRSVWLSVTLEGEAD